MDKQLIIDKMLDARKLTDEAWAIAFGMNDREITYLTEQALDAIDALLNYLEGDQ